MRSWGNLPHGGVGAIVIGGAVAFVVGERAVRAIRPALLLDPDPGWLAARFLLWIFLASAVGAVGGLAAAGFFSWSRSRRGGVGPRPIPLSRRTVAAVAVVALLTGFLLRVVWIDTFPIPFLEDEVNLIRPALELTGRWRDFADSIRPMPYGVSDPHEMIGVLYLRMFRASLEVFGTTVLGVRFLSIAGGILSLLTGTVLAGALLPAGGAAVAALVLAGLRWHLILSRFGWHSVVLIPLVDGATLLMILARRRQRGVLAALAGALVGIGAHFYLATWLASTALFGFCLWPGAPGDTGARRARRLAFCAAGFLGVAAPLFLFREGRAHGYFERTARHSVVAEIRYSKSLLPLASAAADGLIAPWLLPDPEGWHDLPGRSRLGWIVGIPVAIAFARALASPREELSGLLLVNASVALAGAVAGGQAGNPNGFRFGYLTTLTAVAAAAGTLELVRLAPSAHRRATAAAAIGLLAVSGVAGARDALLRWPDHRATFDSFHGEDTLLGRAAMRWDRYGEVRVSAGLGRSAMTIDTVRRYRLSPDTDPARPAGGGERDHRLFRIARPLATLNEGERVVERVRDGWGRDWAVVIGARRG